MDSGPFGDWLGRTRVAEDVVAAGPIRRLALTFDRKPEWVPAEGDPIPPMWHWLFFPEEVALAELGDDGHPRRGLLLPPAPGRRMIAGGSAEFHQSFGVGERVRLESTITSVEEKVGQSGPLVFVDVTNHMEGDAGGEVTEIRNIVFVDAEGAAGPDPEGESRQLPGGAPTVVMTPTLLFRFSALTFNGHRIHYDSRYAQEQEGYQERIAHGPLLALLALEQVEGPVLPFRYRARRPIFVDDIASFERQDVPGGETVVVTNGAGTVALEVGVDHSIV